METKEIINDLLNYNNLKIVQNKDYLNFSIDSLLVANFANLTPGIKKIIDLGTGNAPIPLILSTKTNAKITGVEIQKEIYDLACKTVELNNLKNKIQIINEDIKNLPKIYETDSFELVVCNPPYFKVCDTSIKNKNDIKTNAKHETLIKLEEIIKTAKVLLKNGCSLVMVNNANRISEIIELMNKNNIALKTIQFVHPKKEKEAILVLIEGKKNGKQGVKVLPPIILHKENGEYSDEIKEMFS